MAFCVMRLLNTSGSKQSSTAEVEMSALSIKGFRTSEFSSDGVFLVKEVAKFELFALGKVPGMPVYRS